MAGERPPGPPAMPQPLKRVTTRRPRELVARRALAFGIAALIVLVLGLNGGGYDIVTRQQFFFVLWAGLVLGFATGALPRGKPDGGYVIPLAALAGLLVWMTMSFGWTDSDERTMAEVARVLGIAGIAVLAYAGLNRHTFRAAAAGLSAAAVFVSGYALASRLFPGAFPESEVFRVFRLDRLSDPLDYWNAVATWGAMTIAIGLAWSAHAGHMLARSLSLAAVPVAGLSIYFTYSRGGAIGVAAALAAVLILSRNRFTVLAHALAAAGATAVAIGIARDHPDLVHATGAGAGAGGTATALVLLIGCLGCAGFAAMTWSAKLDGVRLSKSTVRVLAPPVALLVATLGLAFGHGLVSSAWSEFANQRVIATEADPTARLTTAAGSRHDFWDTALDSFREEPMRGTGPGTFEFEWSRDAKSTEFVRDAHSLYLEFLAELGLPGLILLIGFLGGLLAVAWRARALMGREGDLAANIAMTSAFAVFLFQASFDWMWEETAVVVLAVACIAVAGAGGSLRLSRSQRRLGGPGFRVAVVAAAVIACVVQLPGLVGTQRVRASDVALTANRLDYARELADEAVDAEPWAATPYIQRALVSEKQGLYEPAVADAGRAIRREPTNWRHPLLLARIEIRLGDRKRAIRAFRQGERLRPLSPLFAPSSPIGRMIYPPG